MAETLAGMPVQRVFVIHGEPGWDEATPVGPFELYDVQPGRVTREVRDPLDLGIQRCTAADLAGGDAAHNAVGLREVFEGATAALTATRCSSMRRSRSRSRAPWPRPPRASRPRRPPSSAATPPGCLRGWRSSAVAPPAADREARRRWDC